MMIAVDNLELAIFTAIWPLIICAMLFVGRGYIAAWIKASAEHGFNEKIEKLSSELRKAELSFSAELGKRQANLESIRRGPLTESGARRLELYRRQLVAVEQIWANIVALTPLKMVANLMGRIDFKEVAKKPHDKSVQQMFAGMTKGIDIEKVSTLNAYRERPFVTPQVWAYYLAYSSMLSFALMQSKTIEFGLASADLLKSESVDKLVTAALPHYDKLIKDWGPASYYLLLDELEERLIQELQKMLSGSDTDAQAVSAAANITKMAENVRADAAAASASNRIEP